MKNIRFFLSKNSHFLVAKFSVYLNRRVFVMRCKYFHMNHLMTRIYPLFSDTFSPYHSLSTLLSVDESFKEWMETLIYAFVASD